MMFRLILRDPLLVLTVRLALTETGLSGVPGSFGGAYSRLGVGEGIADQAEDLGGFGWGEVRGDEFEDVRGRVAGCVGGGVGG